MEGKDTAFTSMTFFFSFKEKWYNMGYLWHKPTNMLVSTDIQGDSLVPCLSLYNSSRIEWELRKREQIQTNKNPQNLPNKQKKNQPKKPLNLAKLKIPPGDQTRAGLIFFCQVRHSGMFPQVWIYSSPVFGRLSLLLSSDIWKSQFKHFSLWLFLQSVKNNN